MMQTSPGPITLPSIIVKNEGVLVKTDIYWESLYILVKVKPLCMLYLPFWLIRGFAYLREQLISRALPNEKYLPYNQELLGYLHQQKKMGRELYLATSSSPEIGSRIASHLGLFKAVVDIQELLEAAEVSSTGDLPGGRESSSFVYVCHDEDEIPNGLNNRLAGVVLVDSSNIKHRSTYKKHKIEKMITAPRPGWIEYARAIRIHQWIKNLLVFVPLITAHQITDTALLFRATLAFIAFCLCASGVYLLNDLFDIEADRKHPKKSGRPLAAGKIAVKTASLLVPLFTLLAILIGAFLGITFVSILLVYLVITVLYTIWLKRVVLVDVVLLAALYTIRIFAGGAAVAIMPSFWLLSFSMFIFFSLALMKRSSDLYQARTSEQDIMEGRGYVAADARIVQDMGTASGYMSVLVMALYINSEDVQLLYSRPWVLWFICPLLLYWVSRVWVCVSRGMMQEDPILFTIKDWVSYAVAVAACFILWLAS